MRRKLAVLLAGVLVSGMVLSGCGGKNQATRESEESEKTEKEGKGDETDLSSDDSDVLLKVVGISMPVGEEQDHLTEDAREMHFRLEQSGYNSRIVYAEEDVDAQIAQITQMIEDQVAAIIVDPVDPYGLTEVLNQADEAGIPVFSYDALVMDTDSVTYYLTYNTRKVGQMTAQKIISSFELSLNSEDTAAVSENASRPDERETYQIEFLMGEPEKLADLYFYNGIMEVLQPYFENGTLECRSGYTSFDDTSVMGRSEVRATKKLQGILSEYYEDEALDILVTADDAFAIKANTLLNNLEYDTESMFISGYGCSREGAKAITRGTVSCSVFLDYTALADKCIDTVVLYLSGEKPEVDDYEQYDNGTKIVKTIVCDPQMIDGDNYQLLVDGGYYTEQELAITPLPEMSDMPEEPEEYSGEDASEQSEDSSGEVDSE